MFHDIWKLYKIPVSDRIHEILFIRAHLFLYCLQLFYVTEAELCRFNRHSIAVKAENICYIYYFYNKKPNCSIWGKVYCLIMTFSVKYFYLNITVDVSQAIFLCHSQCWPWRSQGIHFTNTYWVVPPKCEALHQVREYRG